MSESTTSGALSAGRGGVRHLLNWLTRYLEATPDADLVLCPWIDFKAQPACTIGKPPTAQEINAQELGPRTPPARGAVTPQRWTRQELVRWAGLIDGTPQRFPGLNDPEDAVRLLGYYRDMVEEKSR